MAKGTKAMTLNLQPAAVKRLKIASIELEMAPSEIAMEAFSLWWKEKGFEAEKGPLFSVPQPKEEA